MKKTIKVLLGALLATTLVALSACGKEKEEVKPTPDTTPDENTAAFVLYHEGAAVNTNDTVKYTLNATDYELDNVRIDFVLENQSEQPMQVAAKIERIAGARSMDNLFGFCTTERCYSDVTCPYTSAPFAVAPGMNSTTPIAVDFMPSAHNAGVWATYRMTIGKGANLSDPLVFFLHVDLDQSGFVN